VFFNFRQLIQLGPFKVQTKRFRYNLSLFLKNKYVNRFVLPSTGIQEKYNRFISSSIAFEQSYFIFILDKTFIRPDEKRLNDFTFLSRLLGLSRLPGFFVHFNMWPV
jgi:hypothetical protein